MPTQKEPRRGATAAVVGALRVRWLAVVSMIAGIAALLLMQLPLQLETAAVWLVLAVLGPVLSTVYVALFRLPDAIVLPAVVVLALVAASASAYRRPDLLARSLAASLVSGLVMTGLALISQGAAALHHLLRAGGHPTARARAAR